jgi:hypothetical protein
MSSADMPTYKGKEEIMSKKQSKKRAKTVPTPAVEPAPAVDITLDGLFFLCFNTDGRPAVDDPAGECQVGFVTTAPQHQITISVKRKDSGGVAVELPGFPITLTHAQARSMQIDLDVPGVKSPVVMRKGHDMSIDRKNPNVVTQNYFKWIIDLENFEMHNTKLPLIPSVLKPVMHINIGEFYTKELSLVKYFRTKVDTLDTDFGSVAAVTGVKIDTLPQDKAFLKVGASTWELVITAGVTYEVIFTNRCPQCDAQQIGNLHLSDFPLHYHAFDVKILDQYDFDFHPPGFPPAVCYPSSGGRTTNL